MSKLTANYKRSKSTNYVLKKHKKLLSITYSYEHDMYIWQFDDQSYFSMRCNKEYIKAKYPNFI